MGLPFSKQSSGLSIRRYSTSDIAVWLFSHAFFCPLSCEKTDFIS